MIYFIFAMGVAQCYYILALRAVIKPLHPCPKGFLKLHRATPYDL